MNRVYLGFTLTPQERQHLLSRGGDVSLIESNGNHADELREAFLGCDVCFGRAQPQWIAESPSLRWIKLDSVGFDDLAKLDWNALGRQIAVTNLAGFFADPVAQSALAGLLAIYRGIDGLVQLQGQQLWQKMAVRRQLRTLGGAKVLLHGYGSIARRFEQLLAPYHCQIAGYSQSRIASGEVSVAEFDRSLPSADVVFCSVPETTSTRGFFDSRRIGLMNQHTVFINVGRGAVVDEDALTGALRRGSLGGAVLDVTAIEPIPSESSLWKCPRLLLTQHTAGGTFDEGLRKVDAFLDNLMKYRAGASLQGVVNWQKGY